MPAHYGAGDGQRDHRREIEARRARPNDQTESWSFPCARFLPGERHSARSGAGKGGNQGEAGRAAALMVLPPLAEETFEQICSLRFAYATIDLGSMMAGR